MDGHTFIVWYIPTAVKRPAGLDIVRLFIVFTVISLTWKLVKQMHGNWLSIFSQFTLLVMKLLKGKKYSLFHYLLEICTPQRYLNHRLLVRISCKISFLFMLQTDEII